MYLIRETMNCKPGKVGEMVRRFKELGKLMPEMGLQSSRVMTDVSGDRFWTVVLETTAQSLDQYTELARQGMNEPRMRALMEGYHDLVESGRREIYKIEE